MGNPRSEAAGGLNDRINALYSDRGFNSTPLNLSQMNQVTRDQLIGDRNRSLSQAGSLATARGYSLGLNNPFTMAQRAESGVYNQYAGSLAAMLGQNQDRYAGMVNSRYSRLAQLLGLQAGNIGNLSTGAWNEQIGPLLGGAIGAGGSIYGGYLSGKHNG